jgi:hypothetical protein
LAGLEACAVLPDIPAGACGNGVIDPGEDCDTFAPTADSMCRSKGTVGECHLDCSRQNDGTRRPCPDDWGCNIDSVCRPPAREGSFAPRTDAALGNGGFLMSADFDADGRADIVSQEPVDTLGRTRLRFHYFDERGRLEQSVAFPKLMFAPVIAELSGDQQSDVAFSDGRVGLLLGRDRTWVPETFGSFWLPGAKVRMLTAYDRLINDASAVVALTTLRGQPPGFYVPNGPDKLLLIGELPGPLETLAGNPAGGNVIESVADSPCFEAALAVQGATEFQLVDFCTRNAKDEVIWRDQVRTQAIPLVPPREIDSPPQITDVDGDGHLDVLVGAGGRPFLARGDGRGLASATPYRLELANPDITNPDIAMPLAVGDFTGDGLVDFVFPTHLLVSLAGTNGAPPRYVTSRRNEGGTWTEARIEDLNGNGKPDVVAASRDRPNIDFFNGTGSDAATAFNLTTNGPVRELSIGDFDGDLVNDLAFAEDGIANLRPDSLMIAFGNVAGSPAAPAAVARIPNFEQLSVYRENGLANLMVASTEARGKTQTGVLTLLEGSGDRTPLAPYGLTLFSADGELRQSTALSLAAGAFTALGERDVLTLAAPNLDSEGCKAIGDENRCWEFWLLPALYSRTSIPVRLEGQLDSSLIPARLGPEGTVEVHVNLGSAAADLDGDGRDEAVFAMPTKSNGCGLVLARPRGASLDQVTLMLDEPCERPELSATDLDGDGADDIVLLTGGQQLGGAKLLALWNDGHGGFSESRLARLSAPEDRPVQFTILPATSVTPIRVAYVTETAARLVTQGSAPREFTEASTLAALEHGTGIVAADVNGDGVVDLALTDSGTLGVMKAELEALR